MLNEKGLPARKCDTGRVYTTVLLNCRICGRIEVFLSTFPQKRLHPTLIEMSSLYIVYVS